jgi:ankyrin repeat protein
MFSVIHTALRSTPELKNSVSLENGLINIFQLIDSNSFEELKTYMNENSAMNLINNPLDGQFAIHRCIQLNRLEMLQFFVEECQADPEKKSSNGDTIWHYAIKSKNRAIIRYMLNKLSVINSANKQKESVLDLVVKQDNIVLLRKILEKGFKKVNLFEATANMNIFAELIAKLRNLNIYATNSDGQSLLHSACRNSNIGLAKSLLADGFDVNKLDKMGRAPIHMAVRSGNVELVTFLVNNGASINPTRKLWGKKSDFVPLIHEAIYAEDPAIISFLIGKGADLNSQEHSGLNAFGLAAKLKLSENILMELIEGGSLPNLFDKAGRSVLNSFKPENPTFINFIYKRLSETDREKLFHTPNLEACNHVDIQCPICKDSIPGDEHIYSLDCKHKYHRDCLELWFQTSFKCPQCNDTIVSLL